MERTDILERIFELRRKKGWSEYRPSLESGIPQSTISSWYRKSAIPTLNSLIALCDAFGIKCSQFFTEDGVTAELTEKQKELLKAFSGLNLKHQDALIEFLKKMENN